MASVNTVFLLGNLVADPEIKSLRDNRSVANFRMATSESWKDRSTGEKKERTEYHNLVCYSDGLVGVIEQYCVKGSKVHVTGRLTTRKWEAQNGETRYTTEVLVDNLVLCGGRSGRGSDTDDQERRSSSGRGDSRDGRVASSNERGRGGSARSGRAPDLDDDIPF